MTPIHLLRVRAIGLAIAAFLAVTACDLKPPAGSGSSYRAAPLAPPGGGPAQGQLVVLLTSFSQTVSIRVTGLAPNTTYSLLADGAPAAPLLSASDGSLLVTLPAQSLPVDPRTPVFSLQAPDGSVALTTPAPAPIPAEVTAELSDLVNVGSAPEAAAEADVWTDGAGSMHFSLSVRRAPPGSYELFVDGTPRGFVDASSGAGVLRFGVPAQADEALLDFDPRDLSLELVLDGQVVFVGSSAAVVPGFDVCEPSTSSESLVAAGGGQALASLARDANCALTFSVHVAGVPMGLYDLVVGGVVRTQIGVGTDDTGATVGDAFLYSRASEPGMQLDVPVIGQPIAVMDGDTPLFSVGDFEPTPQ